MISISMLEQKKDQTMKTLLFTLQDLLNLAASNNRIKVIKLGKPEIKQTCAVIPSFSCNAMHSKDTIAVLAV